MRRVRFLTSILSLLLTVTLACGSNNGSKNDTGTTDTSQSKDTSTTGDTNVNPDFTNPDTTTQEDGTTTNDGSGPGGLACATNTPIGKVCTTNADCGYDATTNPKALCWYELGTQNQPKGICSCVDCTPDSFSTQQQNEDNCPGFGDAFPGNFCGSVLERDSTGKQQVRRYCMKRCSAKLGANDCNEPFSCGTDFNNDPACIDIGCTDDLDCPVNNGKECSVSKPCASGEVCLYITNDGSAGVCGSAGKCNVASGLCDAHTLGKTDAKVGDPCKSDLECAGNMTCTFEIDLADYFLDEGETCTVTGGQHKCCGQCTNGKCVGKCPVYQENGYCTIADCSLGDEEIYPSKLCPVDAVCNPLVAGGNCMKRCDPAKAEECRGVEEDNKYSYECRKYGSLGAWCEEGTFIGCDVVPLIFGQGTDCTVFGTVGNTTNFACRDLQGTVLQNAADPNGYCLDDTTSGGTVIPADGGVSDASSSDTSSTSDAGSGDSGSDT